MVKFLFITANANLNGGTEILAYNLLNGLNNSGLKCKLLSIQEYTGTNPNVFSLPSKSVAIYNIITHNPLDKLFGHIFSDRYLSKEIAKLVYAEGFDWIINHTYDLCSSIPFSQHLKTAQIFNWSVNGYEKSVEKIINNKSFAEKVFSKLGFWLSKKRWHKSLSKFYKLIILTESAKDEVKKVSSNIHDEQFVTIPNPLMFKTDSPKISTLNNKRITFVGRLSYEKGVMRLLRIWETIYKKLPEYYLDIYGEGDAKKEMMEFIENRCLPRVVFKGFCKDLDRIYLNSDLLLMTSDTEGFGMVLIEAMYYGVPCISFDCPVAPKEIIADAGIIVPCYDEFLYSTVVINLLNDQNSIYKLQQNCTKRARNFFIEKVLQKWYIILND